MRVDERLARPGPLLQGPLEVAQLAVEVEAETVETHADAPELDFLAQIDGPSEVL